MPTAINDETIHTVDIRKDIFIAAPVEIVFETVLEELGPSGQLPDGKPFPMKIEPWPGGRWYRDLGEPAIVALAAVLSAQPLRIKATPLRTGRHCRWGSR